MRLLITAGGTGGHVYPALAVADELAARTAVTTLWVGAVGGMEAGLVARAGLPFLAIQGGAVVGVGPLRGALGLARLAWGTAQAWRLIGRFRPQVIFVTGGFTAIAVAVAGWLRRAPLAVYLPDIEPGAAVRLVSRFASRVFVTSAESRRYFPGKDVQVTGYPVRPALKQATPAAAQAHFGLASDRRTLLVTGGSRGARSINRAVLGSLPELLTHLQIIHVSGELDWPEVAAARAALAPALRQYYHAYAYLHEEMGLALAAADLVVSRAGASALGEYPLFGLAAILAPYPHAWRYQKVNADALVAHGAAVRLDDEKLPDELAATIRGVLSTPGKLEEMRRAARAAATPEAAADIGRALGELAGVAVP